MSQNSIDDILVLSARDDPDRSSATTTDHDVYIEYALEPLSPGHCCISLRCRADLSAVLELAALRVGLEFPVDMVWQGFALLGQLVNQGRVVCFDDLVEQCLLGLMALAGGFC